MTKSPIQLKFMRMAALFSLSLGLLVSACSKNDSTPPVVKTSLQVALDSANLYFSTTAEGTKPGEYVVGTRTSLKGVIDAATVVLNSSTSTQADITNAAAQVQAAINTYKGNYIKEIAAANLIGYWKFNGNTNDSSGNGNNGIAKAGHAYYGAGSLTLTADRFSRAGMAYHFDLGANVEIPYVAALNPQQMSISLWSRKSSVVRALNADTYTLFAMNRWNGYKLQYQSANKIFFTMKGVVGTDTAFYDRDDVTAVLDNDVWYHVIVTFKAGEMNFYINGDLVKSWTDTPNSPITLASPVNITIGQDLPTDKYLTVDGDFQVAWGGFFTGDIDDVMFYNVVLTAPQVQSIYTNQKTL